MPTELDSAIRARLETAQHILIASHVRPDGDAIGSLLGLGLALQAAGKKVQMTLADGVPAGFRHLPGQEHITRQPVPGFDLFITVDCADLRRTGEPFAALGKPHINIDHHVTNERFAELNLIEADSVATCAVLTEHLPAWGLEINKEVAASLATGIVTDTLGFRTSNMNAAALRLAAQLVETGIDLPELYLRALVRRPLAAARYWGAGLSKLISAHNIVYTTLRNEEREKAGYPGNDDADLINVISAIEDHAIGMIFVEQPGSVKISWRALQPGYDVSQVAKSLGGGGHQAAAGADIPGNLDEILPEVIQTTVKMLNL